MLIFGEDACVLADALGCEVFTHAATASGHRETPTAEARAFLAKSPGSEVWAKCVWLVTSYRLG